MLGRFLELSIVTPDIRASLDFYAALGFSQAGVGEAWPHPYAVLTDGRICLGLHESASFQPSVTFVRPDLLRHLGQIEDLGVSVEFRRLAGDAFNEIGWRDPSGTLIRLVEARTFSPVERRALQTSLCGYFLEIALPASDPDAAKMLWEKLGFVGMDEPEAALPHVTCTSDTIDIGLYAASAVRQPTLVFEVDDVPAALGGLAAAGVRPAAGRPGNLQHLPAIMLTAPEGTPILIAAADP